MSTHQVRSRYRLMGIGQDISPVVFVDGVNEMGLGVAALYFPGYARCDSLDPEDPSRPAITALELTEFLLSLNASVEGAAFILRTIQIVGAQNPITGAITSPHWPVADRAGRSMIIEKTAGDLHLMDNLIGVLSNSPDFQWHLTSLRNYTNLSTPQSQSQTWGSLELTPLGQDVGNFGLPGDYTPLSRLVGTAFLRTHTPIPAGREEAALTCFHIMESASMPKDPVITNRNTPDYIQYTAFINLSSREYFFRTYDNSCITSTSLPGNLDTESGMKSLTVLNQPATFRRLLESLGTF